MLIVYFLIHIYLCNLFIFMWFLFKLRYFLRDLELRSKRFEAIKINFGGNLEPRMRKKKGIKWCHVN